MAIIWVRRSDYAYSPEAPEQDQMYLYKQVDIGKQPLADFVAQHGVDGAEMPVLPDEVSVSSVFSVEPIEQEAEPPVQESEEADEGLRGGR